MSFGPKLDELPALVPPNGEVLATLEFDPPDTEFQPHGDIFVEEATGLRQLRVKVRYVP